MKTSINTNSCRVEYDSKSKQEVFDLIDENEETVSSLINAINADARKLGLKPNFENVGITFRNKAVELSQEFQASGLSFFINSIQDNNEDSFIGNAILDYLRQINADAIGALFSYRDELKEATRSSSFGRSIVRKFKASLNMQLVSDKEEANFAYIERKYKDYIDKIFKFNIKERGYEAIVKYIGNDMTADDIRDVLLSEVFPTLEKLGYPEIIEKLKAKYEDVLKDEFLAQNAKLKEMILKSDPAQQEEWMRLISQEMQLCNEIDDLLWNQNLNIPCSESESLYSELINIELAPIENIEQFRAKLPRYTELKERILKKYKTKDGEEKPVKKPSLN